MKYLLPLLCVFTTLLTGCQNSPVPSQVKEKQKLYILETTQNYSGLIDVYREKLKNNSKDNETRYKLSSLYYLVNDYDSSIYYLQPMLKQQRADIYLLYAKNLMKLGKINQAFSAVEHSIELNKNNGEAYNILGIILVRKGRLDTAEVAFNQARSLFYDNKKVMTNLAMVNILNKNYRKAYDYLNQLYSQGTRDRIVLNNMLYVIVKLGDTRFARQFAIDNKLSQRPEILVSELSRVEPKDVIHFQFVAPNPIDVKAQHHTELSKAIQLNTEQQNKKPERDESTKYVLNSISPMKEELEKIKEPNIKQDDKLVTSSNSQIIASRVGEHKNYTRLVIETDNKVFAAIKKVAEQEYEITLPDTLMSTELVAKLNKQIVNHNRNFVSASVLKKGNNMIIIKLTTKRIKAVELQHLSSNNKNGLLQVFDFIE